MTAELPTYDIVAVNVRVAEDIGEGGSAEHYAIEEKRLEVEAYIYGRFMYLGYRETPEYNAQRSRTFDLFYLVEGRYTDAIIPRLESGLLWARRSTDAERYKFGM
jgi:hypothetical protein